MPTNTNVTNLKINELTEAQYDAAVQGGTIGANELSVITDLDDAIQVSTMPTAAVGELGKVYQFIGTTDANYTHGYFYECVSDGGNPATYSWSQTNVQPAPSGLPSQTGNSGKFLTTDGTDASWAAVSAGQVIQVATLPTASVDELGNIYQFIGTTDANYTNGCFYKCVVLPNSTYTWQIIYPVDLLQYLGDYYKTLGVGKNVTMTKSGGYIAEYALAVGDNSSVAQNYAVAIGPYSYGGGDNSIAVGEGAKTSGSGSIQIGITSTTSTGSSSVAIGSYTFTNSSSTVVVGNLATANNAISGVAVGASAKVQARSAIQLGSGTNSEAGTLYIGSYYNNAGVNYKLLDADGSIPTDRFTTTPSADGTYVPTLTISSGVATRSWSAPSGGGSTALSLTLAVANWSNNSITVTATGVTASNNVIVSPAPASQSAYTTAGVMCTAQATDSLTFTCTTTPSSDLTVTVLII